MKFELSERRIVGPAGELVVPPDDEITPRLVMLLEGECEGLGAAQAAHKHGLTRQRYYQVLSLFKDRGALPSSARNVDPRPIPSAPTRSSDRSSAIASSIPTPQSTSSPRSFVRLVSRSAPGASNASSRSTAFKKKLHRYRPGSEPDIEVRTTQKRTKPVPCDPRSIEHGVRQFLADKVMGNLAGIWLLVPELLRLGAWDLVCGWTGQGPERVGPRLALQLIHEAALCRTGLRHRRTLNQRIFELANGLPFLASDTAVHELLGARTVADSMRFQVALGKVRRASGHFQGRLVAIDPHRVRSFSKRHMRPHRDDDRERPTKTAQTFFVLDADTGQPICFTTGTSARTAAIAAEELLKLASDILGTGPVRHWSWPIRNISPSNSWTRSRPRQTSTFWCQCPINPARRQIECVAAGGVPATVGRLCDHEVGLHPSGQPGRTVLPIRPAARGAAGGVPLQRIPLDPRWRRG